MLRTFFLLAITGLLIFSSFPATAETGEDDHSDQLKALREEHEQIKNQYIEAKKESRKLSRQNFLGLGKTDEEKEKHKSELQKAKEKEEELREEYMKSKEELKIREKEIKEARKKADREQETTEKDLEKEEKSENSS